MLKDAVSLNALHGYCICCDAPSISHLLFADDSLIFWSAPKDEANVINSISGTYESTSGQQVHLAKSNVLLEKGINQRRKGKFLLTLYNQEVLSFEKYLGLPTRTGRSKKKAFLPLRDRICK